MNLNSEVWGPHGWFFLDSIILSMPEHLDKDKIKTYKTFFYLLQDLLPCEICRLHYNHNLKLYPLTEDIIQSREKMIKWIITLHNIVRTYNNQKLITLTDFINFYKKKYKVKKTSKKKIIK